MTLKTIYNCHIHTFTAQHLPPGFPFPGAGWALGKPWINKPVTGFMRTLNPFSDKDALDRYANFAKVSGLQTQREFFERVRSYYPLPNPETGNPGTKFIVLPMDMEFMGYGTPLQDIFKQHAELATLARDPDLGQQIIPFAAVDPRRDNILDTVKKWVEEDGFQGIKLYPPLGYSPADSRLDPIYAFAQSAGIPIMSHCSRGGVRKKGFKPKDGQALADPDNYKRVLQDFPDLRVCLAHFGGDQDWNDYLDKGWDGTKPDSEQTWLAKILDMIRSGEYPNLFTDISYTIFNFQENINALKVFLDDPQVHKQVLFGSDYYMAEKERDSERRIAINLRGALGEDNFKQIAQTNPEAYLGAA